MRMVPSGPPVAIFLPSGLSAEVETEPRCRRGSTGPLTTPPAPPGGRTPVRVLRASPARIASGSGGITTAGFFAGCAPALNEPTHPIAPKSNATSTNRRGSVTERPSADERHGGIAEYGNLFFRGKPFASQEE